MRKKPLSNLNSALILLVLMIIYTLVINFSGNQLNTELSRISYLMIVAGIMLVVIKYGNDSQNNVTFGNLFAYGFKTTSMLTIFFIAFTILFYLVFPAYKTNLLDIQKQNILKNAPADNQEEIQKSLVIINSFFWVSMIGGILIIFAILGAFGSLIGAFVTKKEPHNFAGDINQIGQ